MRLTFTLSFFLLISHLALSQVLSKSALDPNISKPVVFGSMPLVVKCLPDTTAKAMITGNYCGYKPTQPSDTTTRIRLRCGLTRTKAQPLFVVDGAILDPANFKELDPNTIENITIFKGPPATAIYGHMAQGGVILITTQKTKTREFEIIDAQDGTRLEGASVTFRAVNNKQALSFAADRNGLVTTDELKRQPYEMEVSMVGYKIVKLNVNTDENSRRTIKLERNVTGSFPVVIMCRVRTTGCRYISMSRTLLKTVAPQKTEVAKSKIFPNPIQKGQSFTIELTSPVAATFNARVISVDGRQLLTRSFNVEGTNKVTIETGVQWAPGNYFIQLSNAAGERIRTEQVVVL
jgi:TonB-dependent SusC/RagA subfamily outer membrane receptor